MITSLSRDFCGQDKTRRRTSRRKKVIVIRGLIMRRKMAISFILRKKKFHRFRYARCIAIYFVDRIGLPESKSLETNHLLNGTASWMEQDLRSNGQMELSKKKKEKKFFLFSIDRINRGVRIVEFEIQKITQCNSLFVNCL